MLQMGHEKLKHQVEVDKQFALERMKCETEQESLWSVKNPGRPPQFVIAGSKAMTKKNDKVSKKKSIIYYKLI